MSIADKVRDEENAQKRVEEEIAERFILSDFRESYDKEFLELKVKFDRINQKDRKSLGSLEDLATQSRHLAQKYKSISDDHGYEAASTLHVQIESAAERVSPIQRSWKKRNISLVALALTSALGFWKGAMIRDYVTVSMAEYAERREKRIENKKATEAIIELQDQLNLEREQYRQRTSTLQKQITRQRESLESQLVADSIFQNTIPNEILGARILYPETEYFVHLTNDGANLYNESIKLQNFQYHKTSEINNGVYEFSRIDSGGLIFSNETREIIIGRHHISDIRINQKDLFYVYGTLANNAILIVDNKLSVTAPPRITTQLRRQR